jgi:hypothetical protein
LKGKVVLGLFLILIFVMVLVAVFNWKVSFREDEKGEKASDFEVIYVSDMYF